MKSYVGLFVARFKWKTGREPNENFLTELSELRGGGLGLEIRDDRG